MKNVRYMYYETGFVKEKGFAYKSSKAYNAVTQLN